MSRTQRCRNTIAGQPQVHQRLCVNAVSPQVDVRNVEARLQILQIHLLVVRIDDLDVRHQIGICRLGCLDKLPFLRRESCYLFRLRLPHEPDNGIDGHKHMTGTGGVHADIVADEAQMAYELAVGVCGPYYNIYCVLFEATGPILSAIYHDRLWRESIEIAWYGQAAGSTDWAIRHIGLMNEWEAYYAGAVEPVDPSAQYGGDIGLNTETVGFSELLFWETNEWREEGDGEWMSTGNNIVDNSIQAGFTYDLFTPRGLADAYADHAIIETEFTTGVYGMIADGTILVGAPPHTTTYGTMTHVIDGHTVIIDGDRIRLSLIDVEDSGNSSMPHAALARALCPVGAGVSYDIDDGQPTGRYERTIVMVWCHADGGYAVSLDRTMVQFGLGWINDRYCDRSESDML